MLYSEHIFQTTALPCCWKQHCKAVEWMYFGKAPPPTLLLNCVCVNDFFLKKHVVITSFIFPLGQCLVQTISFHCIFLLHARFDDLTYRVQESEVVNVSSCTEQHKCFSGGSLFVLAFCFQLFLFYYVILHTKGYAQSIYYYAVPWAKVDLIFCQ